MKYKQYIIACLMSLFAVCESQAQQEPQYSQYMFNQLSYNPAYTGSRDGLSGIMLMRKQWVGLEGAPFTGTISAHGPNRVGRHGFGGTLIHDRIGITRQTFLTASYAYRIPLGNSTLAFGLRGGMTQYANLFSDLNPLENDQMNPGLNLSVLLPRAGAGIYFENDHFFIGTSTPNFLRPYYSFDSPQTQNVEARQEIHYFGTVGGMIPLGNKLAFRPSSVVKYVANSPVEADFNAAILYDEFLWLGVGYRTRDALVGMVELNFKGGLRLGYAFDYTLSSLRQVNSGSHEVLLGFDLTRNLNKVVTPRYF